MDSIIFDLDGTLWDSSVSVAKAWNKVIQQFEELNEITADDLKAAMGLQADDFSRKLLPAIHDEFRNEVLQKCFVMENQYLASHGGQLYKNVNEMLAGLSKDYQLFIVSNCQEGYIEAFFTYHQVGGYFLDFENSGRTGLSKGENIKILMERNHITNAIYVGDTDGDRKAAQYAEIPFVYAKYGFGEVAQYHYFIDRLEDLIDLLPNGLKP
ncbi:HAD family hydrolase [Salisediminibacterium beveridgei]|uniref:Putative phosphatase of HAD hydrolase superfamily n=1 Tax=Salisediminibacterium beveridgei TaxID=632773 RepID=A0A1D7QSY0_9BACI|nr:HAD family hydrolase [Salisediminibacterium beveridgei]AOM82099.1 putative phosphatase of HAD hydrolase superfamily [Salisediminibacterium beveridgei]